MSRIGLSPIPIPDGVKITQENGLLTVTGPKGTLSRSIHPAMKVVQDDGTLTVQRASNTKEHRALHGLTRTLISNMVVGVTQGYEKRLEVLGVGYRAELQGPNLVLTLGYSHPVVIEPLPGVEFEVGVDTRAGYVVSGTVQRMPFVIVRSIDKEILGQQAAKIRMSRPPSPYKKPTERFSKGVRYAGEQVRHKAGKTGKAAGK